MLNRKPKVYKNRDTGEWTVRIVRKNKGVDHYYYYFFSSWKSAKDAAFWMAAPM